MHGKETPAGVQIDSEEGLGSLFQGLGVFSIAGLFGRVNFRTIRTPTELC